jgi:hypothetical protein
MAALAPPATPQRKPAYASVGVVAPGWISTPRELAVAVQTITAVFLFTFASLLISGAVALATAPQADAAYEGLQTRVRGASCLKIARRADYTVVFLNLGSPVQRLQLMLDLDTPALPHDEKLHIFSERMHKSQTMHCEPLSPPRSYEQLCSDVTMLAVNTTDTLQLGQLAFVYQNDNVAMATGNPAAMAGLDGTFRLVWGNTYWVTTTDLCFAPHEPETAATEDALPFERNERGQLTTQSEALAAYAPTRDTPIGKAAEAECNSTLGAVRLFPTEAVNEQLVWLSLSDRFLYEYGSQVLEKRRRVVELGSACAALMPELSHVLDMYSSDCGLTQQPCQTEPAIPFRRLATSRMRIDLDHTGGGTLRAEPTDALMHISSLVSHEESLNSALGRLLVLLLTAAVVFLRGSQNAASSRYMFQHTIDVVQCRKQFATNRDLLSYAHGRHEKQEVATDAIISVAALTARFLVLVVSYRTLIADNHRTTVVLEIVGMVGSLLHLLLRYSLDWNLEKEAPLTKLGGPMSVVDCTSAVLMLFADAPLLAADSTKFSSIGRMLISVLVSISVFTRCIFSAAMVSVMAVSATNGARRDLNTHQTVLGVSVLLWIVEVVTTAGNVALLFVRPAALSMARSTPGPTAPIHYAIFFGLVCTSLPTFTKVALRVVEAECRIKKEE